MTKIRSLKYVFILAIFALVSTIFINIPSEVYAEDVFDNTGVVLADLPAENTIPTVYSPSNGVLAIANPSTDGSVYYRVVSVDGTTETPITLWTNEYNTNGTYVYYVAPLSEGNYKVQVCHEDAFGGATDFGAFDVAVEDYTYATWDAASNNSGSEWFVKEPELLDGEDNVLSISELTGTNILTGKRNLYMYIDTDFKSLGQEKVNAYKSVLDNPTTAPEFNGDNLKAKYYSLDGGNNWYQLNTADPITFTGTGNISSGYCTIGSLNGSYFDAEYILDNIKGAGYFYTSAGSASITVEGSNELYGVMNGKIIYNETENNDNFYTVYGGEISIKGDTDSNLNVKLLKAFNMNYLETLNYKDSSSLTVDTFNNIVVDGSIIAYGDVDIKNINSLKINDGFITSEQYLVGTTTDTLCYGDITLDSIKTYYQTSSYQSIVCTAYIDEEEGINITNGNIFISNIDDFDLIGQNNYGLVANDITFDSVTSIYISNKYAIKSSQNLGTVTIKNSKDIFIEANYIEDSTDYSLLSGQAIIAGNIVIQNADLLKIYTADYALNVNASNNTGGIEISNVINIDIKNLKYSAITSDKNGKINISGSLDETIEDTFNINSGGYAIYNGAVTIDGFSNLNFISSCYNEVNNTGVIYSGASFKISNCINVLFDSYSLGDSDDSTCTNAAIGVTAAGITFENIESMKILSSGIAVRTSGTTTTIDNVNALEVENYSVTSFTIQVTTLDIKNSGIITIKGPYRGIYAGNFNVTNTDSLNVNINEDAVSSTKYAIYINSAFVIDTLKNLTVICPIELLTNTSTNAADIKCDGIKATSISFKNVENIDITAYNSFTDSTNSQNHTMIGIGEVNIVSVEAGMNFSGSITIEAETISIDSKNTGIFSKQDVNLKVSKINIKSINYGLRSSSIIDITTDELIINVNN